MRENVTPIPNEYHTINVFIAIKNASKAIQFYKAAFGAEEKSRFEMPDGRIMHAELQIGNSTLQLSDEFPEHSCGIASPHTLKGTSCMIHLYVEDVDAFFDIAIKAGAIVKRQPENMFWGDRYGQLEDPFGHLWSIAAKVENVTPEQIKERANQLFSKCEQS